MSTVRIALANIPCPATPEESVMLAEDAIAGASTERADLVCFPECFDLSEATGLLAARCKSFDPSHAF